MFKICKKFYSILLVFPIILCACCSKNNNYDDNINNIVEIYGCDDENESYGTGFFISDDTIVTNCHVLYEKIGDDEIFLKPNVRFHDEEEYTEVELIEFDDIKDYMKLKYTGKHKHSSYKKIGRTVVGEKCFSIGNFNNYGLSYKEGYVSLKSVNLTYNNSQLSFIQSDLSIGQGDSGAPLLDKNGDLIGMITLRTKNINTNNIEQGFSYSIPANIFMD